MFFWMLQQTTDEQAPIFYTIRYTCHWKGGAIIVTFDLQWHVSMATNTNMYCSTLSAWWEVKMKHRWKLNEWRGTLSTPNLSSENNFADVSTMVSGTLIWGLSMAASDSPFKAAVRFCFKTLPAEFLAIFYRRDVCLISRVVGAKIRWISHTERFTSECTCVCIWKWLIYNKHVTVLCQDRRVHLSTRRWVV